MVSECKKLQSSWIKSSDRKLKSKWKSIFLADKFLNNNEILNGFEALNKAIKGLVVQFKFSESRRATTLDLLAAINEVAPPKDRFFIQQQFAEITLYNIKLDEAAWIEETSQIAIKVDVARFIADGEGNEVKASFDDLVDIVVFNGDPNDFDAKTEILYRQKHKLSDGENELTITVDKKIDTELNSTYIGVDPFVRFIDRDSKDNIVKL